jgi:hypothetical protein
MKEDMMSDDEIEKMGTVTMVLTDQQKRERFLNQLKYSFAKAKNVKLMDTSQLSYAGIDSFMDNSRMKEYSTQIYTPISNISQQHIAMSHAQ